MELTSTAFKRGKAIPKAYTCDGSDISPDLNWTEAPKNAQSFVIVMEDPDAPAGVWTHWVLYNIPADTTHLDKNIPKKEKLPNGSQQAASWGVETFERVGYWGPCPPPGNPHRYFYKLFALDKKLELAPKASVAELHAAMKGHILAMAEMMGLYQR